MRSPIVFECKFINRVSQMDMLSITWLRAYNYAGRGKTQGLKKKKKIFFPQGWRAGHGATTEQFLVTLRKTFEWEKKSGRETLRPFRGGLGSGTKNRLLSILPGKGALAVIDIQRTTIILKQVRDWPGKLLWCPPRYVQGAASRRATGGSSARRGGGGGGFFSHRKVSSQGRWHYIRVAC